MAIITDPDSLNDGVEISVNTGAKTILLNVAGNLSTDGVTIKCVYSKLKELWKSNATYVKFPFPMGPITDEQFEMVNDWNWNTSDTATASGTVNLLRTGGWALKDSGGVSQEEWVGVMTLGSIGASDQAYYSQTAAGSSTTNFKLTGPVNQAVKVYGDVTHGNFDYRSFLNVYCRIQGKAYAASKLSDIGVSTLTYQAYRFPLANSSDVKITHSDAAVATGSPYTGMSINWFSSPQTRSIGGVNRNFSIIVSGNSGTAEQIYEFVQYKLRQSSDIDAGAGTAYGLKTDAILNFVGDTLYTNTVNGSGVFIDDYLSADINRLVFTDDTGTQRTFPYTANLTLNFGSNLVSDTNAKYWVFFTSVPSGDYGTANAVLVNTTTSVMTGSVGGASSVSLTFAYDTNEQGGRTKATDAPITAVAIGLNTAQFIKATGTISRSISNSISLVSPLERNYQNP